MVFSDLAAATAATAAAAAALQLEVNDIPIALIVYILVEN
jgi:hypothetical protein